MIKRFAIIPGIDPEVQVHGPMPTLAEPLESHGISAVDLRDDREKFGDLANPMIDVFPDKLSRTWWRFNSVACTVPDATVCNRLIYHGGLPVVGISNLAWERNAAQEARKGTLEIERPEKHYRGRTGLIIGRSGFNYYHYISDMLIFFEHLVDVADTLGLDRILINPCKAPAAGFQRALLAELYPTLAGRVEFIEGAITADSLTFVCVWPGYFAPPEADEAVKINGIRGVSRKAFRAVCEPFFKRAERILGARDFSDRNRVVIVSRKNAQGRKVINETALLDVLRPFGAERVVMEDLDIRAQMQTAASARVMIGAHGAGMINGGFCQQGAACIELTGRHYLQRAPDFASLAMVRGISYRFVVADEHGEIEHLTGNQGNDIRLSDRALNHITESVAKAVSARSPEVALAAFASSVADGPNTRSDIAPSAGSDQSFFLD